MPAVASIGNHRIAVSRPKGSTNLIANGGFETNTNEWVAIGTGTTIVRSTIEKYEGLASIEVDTPGTILNEGMQDAIGRNVTLGATYTMSGSIKAPVGATILIRFVQVGGASLASVTHIGTGIWERFSITGVFPSSGTAQARPQIFTNTSIQNITYYLDALQFELGPTATPYISTDGAAASRPALKWLG